MPNTDDIETSRDFAEVAKSNSNRVPRNSVGDMPRALYVGTGGDVVVQSESAAGGVATFKNIPSGTLLPIRVSKVLESSTADDFVLLY